MHTSYLALALQTHLQKHYDSFNQHNTRHKSDYYISHYKTALDVT